MKKVSIVLLVLCMMFSAAGCGNLEEVNSLLTPEEVNSLLTPKEAVFSIDSYGLQVTADSTFHDETGGNFDLQIANGSCYVSFMAYKYIDLPEGVTPADAYEIHNEDLLSKRTAVKTVEETETQTLPQGTLMKTLYSAERDGVKNYYASYMIDLPDAETCAWVLVTATPSYLVHNREYLHDIVCSLTPAP